MGDQWSRRSRGSSPPPGLWTHLAELGLLVGARARAWCGTCGGWRPVVGHEGRPYCLTDRWLSRWIERGWRLEPDLGFYGPSLQRVWPERHRRELASPYIRNPDRARRILLRSPWADLSTEDAAAAAGRYQSATGLSRRPETIMAEVLALPARTRRTLLDRGGYGASVITELPFAALRAAYADLGVDQVTARAWYRAGIGPREAGDWTSHAFSCADAQQWRTVMSYPWTAARWRDHDYDVAAARHWIKGHRFLDPDEVTASTTDDHRSEPDASPHQ